MLEAGTYRGKPVRGVLGITSTGKEQILVEFVLVDPPGERVSWFGFFTEKTFDRTIESLRACGWKGSDLSDFVAGAPAVEGFDQEVDLVVEHEEYNGQVRAKVAWVNSGGGIALKTALTADQARSFAARMKGKIVALDKGAARPAAAPARPPARARPAPQDDRPPQDHIDQRALEELGGKIDAPF